jgi:geranylgeranyl reductase family protein
MFDVAIVGAGPSGLMLARLLGTWGRKVALIEEHESAGEPVNCSGIIGVEAFQKFDLPVNRIIRQIDSIRFYAPGGATFHYKHHLPLAYAVNRAKFDEDLAEKAVQSGAELITGTRINGIEVKQDQVRLVPQRSNGMIEAKFAVIAAGGGTKLTQLAGLGSPRRYVLGAQTECATITLEEVEVHLGRNVAPSNFAWVIPAGDGIAKIGLICDRNASESLKHFLSGPALRGRLLGAPGSIRCSLLPLDTLRRSYSHRTIVVGEAAGQIKTITCGGIYYGLLAAQIAAEVIEGALRIGNGSARILAEYERRWKKLLDAELKAGRRLRSIFRRLSDAGINALFETADRDGIMALIREKVNFDWHRDLVASLIRHVLVSSLLNPLRP